MTINRGSKMVMNKRFLSYFILSALAVSQLSLFGAKAIPAASIEPVVTWVGQGMFLIQMNGFNVLTDPISSPKDSKEPEMQLEDLPHIDAIIISTDLAMDADVLKHLAKKYDPVISVPNKTAKVIVENMGFSKVLEQEETTSLDHLNKDGRIVHIGSRAVMLPVPYSILALGSSWEIITSDQYISIRRDETGAPYSEVYEYE